MEKNKKIFEFLEKRFASHMHRHPGINRSDIVTIIDDNNELREILERMEKTGGEPDIVMFPDEVLYFVDCSEQSPQGRRSLCYDQEALNARKKYPPSDAVMNQILKQKVQLLNEEDYKFLQSLGPVDTKTSSRIATPDEVRSLGGALFGDYRYGKVFVYHNGADSYYASRGYRVRVAIS